MGVWVNERCWSEARVKSQNLPSCRRSRARPSCSHMLHILAIRYLLTPEPHSQSITPRSSSHPSKLRLLINQISSIQARGSGRKRIVLGKCCTFCAISAAANAYPAFEDSKRYADNKKPHRKHTRLVPSGQWERDPSRHPKDFTLERNELYTWRTSRSCRGCKGLLCLRCLCRSFCELMYDCSLAKVAAQLYVRSLTCCVELISATNTPCCPFAALLP